MMAASSSTQRRGLVFYFIPVITIRRKARAETNVATSSLSATLRGLIVANY